MRRIVTLFVIASTLAAGGCNSVRHNKPAKKYSITELINIVNDNISKIHRIRCKGGSISIKLPPDQQHRRVDLSGVVMLFEPTRKFYLSANLLGQPKLYIGSNNEKYWIGILEGKSRLNWGYWKNADRKCNPARTGPQKLLEALGLVKLRDMKYLGPFLQVRENANVLMYGQVADSGEWYFAKEVYITRYEPIVVTKIVYLTASGERELIIDLSDYYKLPSGGYIPRRIGLYWPMRDSFMKIKFDKITSPGYLPESAFGFPDTEGYEIVEQIDKDCK